jgi:hypothetical protein
MLTFKNNSDEYFDRLVTIAQLYYRMGVAPKYHNIVPTLHHALRMVQHAVRFNPSNTSARELLLAITSTLGRVGTEQDHNRAIALLQHHKTSIFNPSLVSMVNNPLPLIKGFMGQSDTSDAVYMLKLAEIVKDRRNKMIEGALKKDGNNCWSVSR